MDYQVCKTNNDRFDKTMHTHDKEIAFNKSILIDDLTMWLFQAINNNEQVQT